MSDKKLILAAVVLLCWGGYDAWTNRWMRIEDSAIRNAVPLQQPVDEPAFAYKDFTVKPVASFLIEARLLSKTRYRLGKAAALAPVDYALGWGPMARERVLKEIKISQSNRWYRYRYRHPAPLAEAEIARHSGNMHLIPADNAVFKLINKARPGQIVRLRGFLVNVTAEDGWYWNSSLSRDDTGAHSCELFWVQEILLL